MKSNWIAPVWGLIPARKGQGAARLVEPIGEGCVCVWDLYVALLFLYQW